MVICRTEVSGGGDGTGKYESKTCSYFGLLFSLIIQYFCFYMVFISISLFFVKPSESVKKLVLIRIHDKNAILKTKTAIFVTQILIFDQKRNIILYKNHCKIFSIGSSVSISSKKC